MKNTLHVDNAFCPESLLMKEFRPLLKKLKREDLSVALLSSRLGIAGKKANTPILAQGRHRCATIKNISGKMAFLWFSSKAFILAEIYDQ